MNKIIPTKFISISRYLSKCDYIFNQKFKEVDYENNRLSQITDDSTVYCWSGFLNGLFEYLQNTNIKNITLISGCEDLPANPNGLAMGFPIRPVHVTIPCPLNITKWFAQNAEICSDFIKPIPIGPNIYPLSCETLNNYKVNIERKKLIFTNMGLNSNPHQRTTIRNMILKQCPTSIINPLTTMEEYTKGLQEHIFSLCPPGNGKDTHRAWESILFGCIPIVEKSNMNDFFAELFPILVVNRWSEITEEFLYENYEKIKNKKWRYDLLDVDNYFNYCNIPQSNKHIGYHKILESLPFTLSPETDKNVLYL